MTSRQSLLLISMLALCLACRLDKEHLNVLPETETNTEEVPEMTTDTTDTSNEVVDNSKVDTTNTSQDTMTTDVSMVDTDTMSMEVTDNTDMMDNEMTDDEMMSNCTTCIISTFAGTGEEGYNGDGIKATDATLTRPASILFDEAQNLYFSDRSNHRIRKIDAQTGIISTIAGVGEANFFSDGGPADLAAISYPSKLVFGPDGQLYFSDDGNYRIRRIDLQTNKITTFAGNGGLGFAGDGGPALNASFYVASSITFDKIGNAYVTDQNSHRVRRIDHQTNIITTVVGNGEEGMGGEGGLATEAQLDSPTDVAFDDAGNMYIADQNNSRICKIDAQTEILTTIAGTGQPILTNVEGLATQIPLFEPRLLTYRPSGHLYIAMNTQVRQLDLSTGIIKTIVGGRTQGYGGDGGPPLEATTYGASGVTFDEMGNLYFCDRFNHRIRKVTICETGEVCW